MGSSAAADLFDAGLCQQLAVGGGGQHVVMKQEDTDGAQLETEPDRVLTLLIICTAGQVRAGRDRSGQVRAGQVKVREPGGFTPSPRKPKA